MKNNRQNFWLKIGAGSRCFLKTFTTQLKNQNPLDPMENEAFVAQLAQFSSLEAMTGVRSSMDSMAADSKSSRFLLGSTLIGRKNRAIRKPGEY